MNRFQALNEINRVPEPYEALTTELLWTDEYVSARMLEFHLDGSVDLSSRKTDFIDRSAAWLAERFDLGPGRKICDFGCGPGLYTSRLARLGAKVTGVDFSPRSIDHARRTAREEGLEIDYHLRNYLEFDAPGRFDLITMIFCDFCALSPEQRRQLTALWSRLLAPGGAVVLDVHSLNQFDLFQESATYQYHPADGFWAAGPYYEFLNAIKYEELGLALFKYTIVEAERERVVYNWLQCFNPQSLDRELNPAGLKVCELYDNVAGEPYSGAAPDLGVVAMKAD